MSKSLNNQPCQARPTVANINSDETLFYPFTIIVNKCGGGCNAIDDPYAPFCVPNKVKKYSCKSILFNIRGNGNKTFSLT